MHCDDDIVPDYYVSQADLDQRVRQRETSHNAFNTGLSVQPLSLQDIYDKYADKWVPDWEAYEQAVANYVRLYPEEKPNPIHPYDKMTIPQLLKLQFLMLLEAFFKLSNHTIFLFTFAFTTLSIWLGMVIWP